MHPGPRLLLAAVCATLLGPAGAARAGEGDADVRLLRECGVGTDAAAVLDFFRARTLDDARRGRIAELIGRLGHPRFAVRERATKELRGIGEAARPLLRAAAESDDAETARRAQLCLEALDRGPGGSLTVAALRRLEALAPPGAAPV
ncbi:MAG TPA: hypothetical protein VIL46_10295, partial [Gemmataceae bacterium]